MIPGDCVTFRDAQGEERTGIYVRPVSAHNSIVVLVSDPPREVVVHLDNVLQEQARMSPAWEHLKDLQPGDLVPPALYVLDYRDGERPRWQVQAVEELDSGGRKLTLVDPDNGKDDLFADLLPTVSLVVLTWPTKTLRTQPFLFGTSFNTLCDLDQQARHVARLATR